MKLLIHSQTFNGCTVVPMDYGSTSVQVMAWRYWAIQPSPDPILTRSMIYHKLSHGNNQLIIQWFDFIVWSLQNEMSLRKPTINDIHTTKLLCLQCLNRILSFQKWIISHKHISKKLINFDVYESVNLESKQSKVKTHFLHIWNKVSKLTQHPVGTQ